MPTPMPSFAEPLMKLVQSNLSVWTQFWMAPEQPWSMAKVDLFGGRAPAPALPSTEAISKLWSGLAENQSRFLADVSQTGFAFWGALPSAFQSGSAVVAPTSAATS